MNKRFILLSVASIILRLVGLVMLVGGIVMVFYFLTMSHDYERQAYAGASAATALSGIIVAVFGELIGVMFAIEANTRRAADSAAGKTIGAN